MRMRFSTLVAIPLVVAACGGGPLLSPVRNWGSDFSSRSPATAACPGGSLRRLRGVMYVSPAMARAAFVPLVDDPVLGRMSDRDRLHTFRFSTDPESPTYWGFEGYLVARDDCIVHAAITGHDN
ncbi:MAG: hypothetical protein ACOY82_14380 [Pseudomonadota bacterium]